MPIWSFLLSCLFASALVSAEPDDATPNPQVADFLGPAAVRIIAGATKVEAFRVDPRHGKVDPNARVIDGYPIIADAGERPDALPTLRANLFDAATYDFDSAKKCGFMPGVAFRVWKEQEHVDVLICYSCNELSVISYDTAGAIAKRSQEDCDHARPSLLRLAKAAFPGDVQFQSLK
jgi:hypothetical protein